jgi:hypothetical protein
VEHVAHGGHAERQPAVVVDPSRLVGELRELIAALDRRMPHVAQAGEATIARDAAALRALAVKRIEELERDARDDERPRAAVDST